MAASGLTCVVDDDADYRFLLQQLFNRHFPDHPVRFFASGQAFFDELPKINPKPRLILLDRHMPGVDGHQVLLMLKQHIDYKKIPIVMMSADASAFEINDCYEADVNSFIIKPIDFNLLKQAISTICQYWLEFNQEPVESSLIRH